jgi:hypothetical protein
MNASTLRALSALFGIASSVIAGADPIPSFSEQTNFPPAAGFGVVADTLGDGRFIVYDGLNIWIQDSVDANAYTNVATGYTGDPAIIAVSSDGHTCLVGAGFTGELWLFDAEAPADAGAPLLTSGSDFWAEWINASQVVIDRAVFVGPGMFDFEAELILLDITGPAVRTVVSAKGGASAMCVLDLFSQNLYATDGLTGETKAVSVSAIVNAFNTSTPVSWASLPTFGTFSTGGPGGLTPKGTLLFGGFGAVDFVDRGTAASVGTADPAGTGTYNFLLAYNGVTGRVLATGTQFSPSFDTKGFVSTAMFETLPASGGWALALLVLGLVTLGARHVKSRPAR